MQVGRLWLLSREIPDLFLLTIWWALALTSDQTPGVCQPAADRGCRQDSLYIRIQSRNRVFSLFKPLWLKSCARNSTFQLVSPSLWHYFSGARIAYQQTEAQASATRLSGAWLSVLLWLIYSNSPTWTWGSNCNPPGWCSLAPSCPEHMMRLCLKMRGRKRTLKYCCIGNNSSLFPFLADFWSASVPHVLGVVSKRTRQLVQTLFFQTIQKV